jgi:REP element-mobilizing transposase RayT
VIQQQRYTCYACAIMPDHVHALIRRHRDKSEQMIKSLQDASREALIVGGKRSENHPVWGGPGWKVFLNTRDDIKRIIAYIEDNPLRAKRLPQKWSFVTKYDGWMPYRSS